MMQKLLTLLAVAPLFFMGARDVRAQQADSLFKPVPMEKQLLPYDNPMEQPEDKAVVTTAAPSATNLDSVQKEILSRIAEIYRIQVLAIDSQVNEDPVSTESYINKAFSELQNLLDQYPEVQNQPRFTELYRSVMAEYRAFYGINEPMNEAEGEIFAIRKEVFSESDDLNVDNYELPSNVSVKKTDVPLVQNRQVNRHLIYFTMKRPEVMERWLERSERYFPMMRRIFKEEGVPTELIHLAMIESGLVPTARSHAAAVGMWQFIQATGSMYGLEVNWWIDERRDPVKATRAAARHLKDLYNIWGDWYLAMANYNLSPRRLKRAVRLAGEEDYWAAYRYLPRETRGYIPSFIATTMIAMNPEEFGFSKDFDVKPYSYEVVQVDGLMPLDKLAEAAGISTEKLKDYNPELKRWATPPGDSYPLKIPDGTKKEFVANYKKIPKSDRSRNIVIHKVKRGETLGQIAIKYGATVRSLFEVNKNLSSTIYPGQKIMVPLPPGSSGDIAASRPSNQPRGATSTRKKRRRSAPSNSTAEVYVVKKGDTIGHIAEWYDTAAWKIRAWNGSGNRIWPGQHLTIYVPKSKSSYYSQINDLSFSEKQEIERKQRQGVDVTSKRFASANSSGSSVTYRVRPNDTLGEIADSFNTTVGAIKRLNNLNSNRIYVGQELIIKTD